MMGSRTWLLLFASLVAGCGETGSSPTDSGPTDSGLPGPSASPPAAPASNDPAYRIDGLHAWSIIGNGLTAGDAQLSLTVTAPAGARVIDAWLDKAAGVRLIRKDAAFVYTASLASLPPGQHQILLAADGSQTAFARLFFTRTHPLYVAVVNDWDDPDNSDASLALQEKLHANHPALRLTHFVGPYTFTDPAVSAARATKLAGWVDGLRNTYTDEIGLHIHPWCSFVKTTTVPCRTTPSFAYATDADGYTVNLDAYTEQEMLTLLKAADKLFTDHGLGKPTSFRAGGWTALAHTLKALTEDGFVVDASACNWTRMEEWKGYPGANLYEWNAQHWSSIGDTSQPYYPSTSDAQSSAKPQLPILEVPDNGLMVDYVTATEMIDILKKIWSGGELAEPRVFSIGYHPPNFDDEYFKHMDGALAEVDLHLASADKGPVIYVTMSELARAFPQQ
jgi:hypothetical protein